MMPMRGALTLGTTAQDLIEALVMQLAEKKARHLHSQAHLSMIALSSNICIVSVSKS